MCLDAAPTAVHAHDRGGARKTMRGFYWVIDGLVAGCPRPGGRERGHPFERKKDGRSEEGEKLDQELTWLEEQGVGAVLSMTKGHWPPTSWRNIPSQSCICQCQT